MAKEKAKPKRTAGEIEALPSGSLRVKLYAGLDPISKARVYLRETVTAGPDAEKQAEQVLIRFRHEVYERRHPRINATVEQLIERHLADAKLGFRTTLVRFRCSGPERLYGFLRGRVFHIIWWHPSHLVWPSMKKHT
jgi:hypothetical protein